MEDELWQPFIEPGATDHSDGFFEADKDLGVCCLHLISGEDVLGHLLHREGVYTIQKPVLPNVNMGMTAPTLESPEGQPTFRVGLLPLRPFLGNVKEIEVPESSVMYTPIRVSAQMEKLYLQFVSSIILAPAGSVPSMFDK